MRFDISHNEERGDLDTSPNTVRTEKCRKLLSDGHVARMELEWMHPEFWWENLLESGHVQDKRRRQDNIKVDLREMRCKNGKVMELAQDDV